MKSTARSKSRRAYWQAHLERAGTLKMSLAEYGRTRGLSVQSLYNARHASAGKPREIQSSAATQTAAGVRPFVAVALASQPSSAPAMACRIQLRDVVIECARLPEAVWLAALARGAADVVP
jgi:hypothetical protein